MRINFGRKLEIRDLGNHRAVDVISLGMLLTGIADVTPDPKRRGFYEVEHGRTVYYFSVSPLTGTIFLLAKWRRATPPSLSVQKTPVLSPLTA